MDTIQTKDVQRPVMGWMSDGQQTDSVLHLLYDGLTLDGHRTPNRHWIESVQHCIYAKSTTYEL